MAGEVNLQILRNEFVQFLDDLPHEELRQNLFTIDLEVANRMFNLAEGTCSECVLFLRIFEAWNCDVSVEITELLEQLLKLYEDLTERYK